SFFNTQENIKEDTGMSPHQQRKALKLLQDNGFLTIKRRDVPAKNYFLINEENILNFLIKSEKTVDNVDGSQMLKNLTSRSEKIEHLDVKNFNTNNNKLNNNKDNNNKSIIIDKEIDKSIDLIFKYLEERKLNTIKNRSSVKRLNKKMDSKEVLEYIKELYDSIEENKSISNPKGLFSSKLEKGERQNNKKVSSVKVIPAAEEKKENVKEMIILDKKIKQTLTEQDLNDSLDDEQRYLKELELKVYRELNSITDNKKMLQEFYSIKDLTTLKSFIFKNSLKSI
ncbi:MAG: hypothetical protein ACRCZL_05405, partial [Cetobacterium sp.]